MFWFNLFRRFSNDQDFPAIITLNYDLVLESSLFQVLINKYFDSYNLPLSFRELKLDYHYQNIKRFTYKINYVQYEHWAHDDSDPPIKRFQGTTLESCEENTVQNFKTIDLLKLHGSLNFPTQGESNNDSPVKAVDNAYILPPILNKWIAGNEQNMWKVALQKLREAKNVIIIGYSLPQTDIYMQYFLKAGLGPNFDLNKVYIFNPALWKGDDALRDRYGDCFSPQLRKRIIFQPFLDSSLPKSAKLEDHGTFERFVRLIESENELFF